MKTGWMAALGAVLLFSCATYRLEAPREPLNLDGVSLETTADQVDGVSFFLRVTNGSSKTVDLQPSQFRLYAGSPGAWTPLPLLSEAEVLASRGSSVRFSVVTTRPVVSSSTTIIHRNPGGGTVIVTRRPTEVQTGVVVVEPGAYGPSGDLQEVLRSSLFAAGPLAPGETRSGWVYAPRAGRDDYRLVVPVGGKSFDVVYTWTRTRNSPFINLK